MDLLQPIDKEITLPDGGTKTYIISKFPAIAGREIITQYPLTAAPKVGDYAANESLMLKIMTFVAVPTDNGPLRLTTKDLVNNHVPDFETLMKLEWAMIEYNCSFLQNGAALTFLSGLKDQVFASISQTLTRLSQPSSASDSQPSES